MLDPVRFGVLRDAVENLDFHLGAELLRETGLSASPAPGRDMRTA